MKKSVYKKVKMVYNMKNKEDKIMDKEELGCGGSCHSCSGCGHDHDHEAAIPADFSPIITLTDDNGVDTKFEVLDVVMRNGRVSGIMDNKELTQEMILEHSLKSAEGGEA